MNYTAQVPQIILEIYRLVGLLEELFPKLHFTPDGHLVGSIGEALAASRYGLSLLPASTECHDAIAPSGVGVQVKTTQGSVVAMRGPCDHLIVLLIDKGKGTSSVVYNGPGKAPWEAAGRMQKNGQRPISLAKLRQLVEAVQPDDQLPVVGP